MSDTPTGCTVEGKAIDGLDTDSICAALREGFASGGGDDAMAVAVAIRSAREAEGRVLAADGSEMARLTLDISDAALNRGSFRHLGSELAAMARRHLDTAT